MTKPISRRNWIKTVGAAGASGLLLPAKAHPRTIESTDTVGLPHPLTQVVLTDGEITALNSTSEVFIPPRGNGFMKF